MTITYTGPSTAAVICAGVINDAITISQTKTDLEEGYVRDTLELTENPILINSVPRVDAGVVIPDAPEVDFDPNGALALYDTMRQQITQQLADGFTNYITNYFPLGTEISDAAAWVKRALTTGGSGVNANVENQLWNRDRDRLMADERRAESEIGRVWAARRYPLPPGAASHQVALARLTMQKAIGESSRERTVKTFELEVENARLAVEKAIDLRRSAISTALDYMRALALGPQLGAQLAGTLLDAESKVASIVTDFYRAQIVAAEIPLRVGTANAELVQRTNEANQKSQLENMSQRVATTMSAAQALATQAAALLNGIHAQTSFSGSESV